MDAKQEENAGVWLSDALRHEGVGCYDGLLFDSGIKPTDTVYLDRMWQWNPEKYDQLAIKYWGIPRQTLDRQTTPSQVEAFMADYLGHPLTLCKITRTTSQFNGYSYWQLDYANLSPAEKSQTVPHADRRETQTKEATAAEGEER